MTDLPAVFTALADNIEKVVRGKRQAVELALICLLAEGHLLIEDVPGTGKTTLARCLAASLRAGWQRIQFTPDLLPADITGTSIFRRGAEQFEFRPGPVFAHVVLGDEINRASPKTQSALLEVMEERQVTVDGRTHPVPRPFMVIATQNRVDMTGTYPLPEAQLDRFLIRTAIGYPDAQAEAQILSGSSSLSPEDLPPVADTEVIAGLIAAAQQVYTAAPLHDYIIRLVSATRDDKDIQLGVSPRGSLALLRAVRVRAAAAGRAYAIPDDVKALAGPVLAHRLILTPEAALSGLTADDVIAGLVESVPTPRTADQAA